jgi:phi13 family phage major tail protein
MPEEKVTFGLDNVHYATYTVADGVITFDAPIPIPGAVEMTNDPLGDPISFYADDMQYYYADNNQGYEGVLTIARVPDSFKTSVLGEELDETDQVMAEYADAQTKPFALLFQFKNDMKARRHVMYNCNARRPSINSSTKTDSTEVNTTELNYNASPVVMDGRPIVKVSTTQATTDAIYNPWFDAVYKKTVVTP